MPVCGFAWYNVDTTKVLASPNESERKLHFSLTVFSKHGHCSEPHHHVALCKPGTCR